MDKACVSRKGANWVETACRWIFITVSLSTKQNVNNGCSMCMSLQYKHEKWVPHTVVLDMFVLCDFIRYVNWTDSGSSQNNVKKRKYSFQHISFINLVQGRAPSNFEDFWWSMVFHWRFLSYQTETTACLQIVSDHHLARNRGIKLFHLTLKIFHVDFAGKSY